MTGSSTGTLWARRGTQCAAIVTASAARMMASWCAAAAVEDDDDGGGGAGAGEVGWWWLRCGNCAQTCAETHNLGLTTSSSSATCPVRVVAVMLNHCVRGVADAAAPELSCSSGASGSHVMCTRSPITVGSLNLALLMATMATGPPKRASKQRWNHLKYCAQQQSRVHAR
eukprot:scaffold3746_cov319-Prasinococcus_capsulatus_cf.AAC.2